MAKIKDLPRFERPREKLLKYGPTKLTTTELLAIILRTGIKGKNVIEISNQILKTIGILNIKNTTITDLKKIKGLGNSKIAELLACLELGKRLIKEKKPLKILSPQIVFESLKDIRNNKKEHFLAIYLDTKNEEIGREIISVGILNTSIVHPREVFEPAIRFLAHSLIVVHNHPSGEKEPSKEDILITENLIKAGKIMGIDLKDHIIITTGGYFSFKERGMIYE